MKFVVKRKRWLCGDQEYRSNNIDGNLLRDTKGNQCCLGFVCRQISIPTHLIENIGPPSDVAEANELDPKGLEWRHIERLAEVGLVDFDPTDMDSVVTNTGFAAKAMRINDDTEITDKVREKQLKVLFRENGHTIQFVD